MKEYLFIFIFLRMYFLIFIGFLLVLLAVIFWSIMFIMLKGRISIYSPFYHVSHGLHVGNSREKLGEIIQTVYYGLIYPQYKV